MTGMLIKATDRFSETAIDAEIVVMNLDSGDFFSLSGTARAIWLLIDGAHDRDALVAELARQFDMAPDAIVGEVDQFLAQLINADLVRLG